MVMIMAMVMIRAMVTITAMVRMMAMMVIQKTERPSYPQCPSVHILRLAEKRIAGSAFHPYLVTTIPSFKDLTFLPTLATMGWKDDRHRKSFYLH